MKITWQEVVNRDTWIKSILMNTLTGEMINDSRDNHDCTYEVKLLVNGFEVEPSLLEEIMINIEDYIKAEAKSLVREKFINAVDEASNRIFELAEITKELSEKFEAQLN